MLSLKEHAPSGRLMATEAFTLIELIIVVTIVLILAATAISQTGSIRQLLTFNNTFEQVVFMVQRARTMALTQQEGTSYFGIDLSTTGKAKLIALPTIPTSPPVTDTEIEAFTLPKNIFLAVASNAAPSCLDETYIFFANSSSQTRLWCSGAETLVTSLTVTLCQPTTSVGTWTSCPSGARQKSFTIHRAAGVPQF